MEYPFCKPLFPPREKPLRHRHRRRNLPFQGRPGASHRRGGLWPPPFGLFRSGDHRSPLRLVRRPVSTVWPTIVSPVVLPPAGEAPAKRVMRENDGSQSAVEIGEVGIVLPHLSAALTSSPAGGGTNPSVTAAGGGDTSPCRGGHGVPSSVVGPTIGRPPIKASFPKTGGRAMLVPTPAPSRRRGGLWPPVVLPPVGEEQSGLSIPVVGTGHGKQKGSPADAVCVRRGSCSLKTENAKLKSALPLSHRCRSGSGCRPPPARGLPPCSAIPGPRPDRESTGRTPGSGRSS